MTPTIDNRAVRSTLFGTRQDAFSTAPQPIIGVRADVLGGPYPSTVTTRRACRVCRRESCEGTHAVGMDWWYFPRNRHERRKKVAMQRHREGIR